VTENPTILILIDDFLLAVFSQDISPKFSFVTAPGRYVMKSSR